MFVDHAGAFVFTHEQWLRGIGRGAAPVFLFLAGYASSYRFRGSLLLLALALTISDTLLAGHLRVQNILFDILLCRMVFAWFEKKGRVIERPYEWFIGSVSLVMSVFLVDYGTLGFTFALLGYMQRRREHYPETTRKRLFLLTFITYGVIMAWGVPFHLPAIIMMIVSLSFVYRLLWQFTVHDIRTTLPPWILRAGKWVSYYSGIIYVVHLIALEWATGIPI